jgi:hypothetical protein
MRTFGDNIAVAPFDFDHNKGVKDNTMKGFATTDRLAQKLVPSKVIFDSEHFKAGQTVYFAGDIGQYPSTRVVMTVNDIKFIVLKESQVIVGE